MECAIMSIGTGTLCWGLSPHGSVMEERCAPVVNSFKFFMRNVLGDLMQA